MLTREIIKDLGWVHLGGFWWEWPVKGEIYIDDFSSRSLDFKLNFVPDNTVIHIDAYERNSFDWERVFAGPCENKEELEYLMKIFNIL